MVDIVGGRFIHLLTASSILAVQGASPSKDDVQVISHLKAELFKMVYSELKLLHITETPTRVNNHSLSAVTWSVAKEILASKNKQIEISHFNNMTEELDAEGKNFLEKANIFSISWIKHYVTFQSTLVQSFFKSQLEYVLQLNS